MSTTEKYPLYFGFLPSWSAFTKPYTLTETDTIRMLNRGMNVQTEKADKTEKLFKSHRNQYIWYPFVLGLGFLGIRGLMIRRKLVRTLHSYVQDYHKHKEYIHSIKEDLSEVFKDPIVNRFGFYFEKRDQPFEKVARAHLGMLSFSQLFIQTAFFFLPIVAYCRARFRGEMNNFLENEDLRYLKFEEYKWKLRNPRVLHHHQQQLISD